MYFGFPSAQNQGCLRHIGPTGLTLPTGLTTQALLGVAAILSQKKKYVPIPAAPVIKDTTLGVRVLEKGLSGPDVLHLERLLLSKGYKLIKPNRYFDEKTELVVKDFQKKTGIQADGKVGPLTIYYLTND